MSSIGPWSRSVGPISSCYRRIFRLGRVTGIQEVSGRERLGCPNVHIADHPTIEGLPSLVGPAEIGSAYMFSRLIACSISSRVDAHCARATKLRMLSGLPASDAAWSLW
jgi:hypothetical protein